VLITHYAELSKGLQQSSKFGDHCDSMDVCFSVRVLLLFQAGAWALSSLTNSCHMLSLRLGAHPPSLLCCSCLLRPL
jgi:hypothetical protein